MNATKARQYFSVRTLINCLIILAIFVPLAFVFAKLPYGWIWVMALIGALYFLFFYVLETRTGNVPCSGCGNKVDAGTPWICGFCGAANKNTVTFPFIHKCEHCGAAPKAYKCHHCGDLVFLSPDRQRSNFARCLAAPSQDELAKESAIQQREKQALDHKILIAELNAKLDAMIRDRSAQHKSPRAALEESLDRSYTRTMGVHEIMTEKRAEARVKYPNDPERLQQAFDAIEAWGREQL